MGTIFLEEEVLSQTKILVNQIYKKNVFSMLYLYLVTRN